MVCFPAAFVLGIVGIVLDRPKWPAMAVTVLVGGALFVFVVLPVLYGLIC